MSDFHCAYRSSTAALDPPLSFISACAAGGRRRRLLRASLTRSAWEGGACLSLDCSRLPPTPRPANYLLHAAVVRGSRSGGGGGEGKRQRSMAL